MTVEHQMNSNAALVVARERYARVRQATIEVVAMKTPSQTEKVKWEILRVHVASYRNVIEEMTWGIHPSDDPSLVLAELDGAIVEFANGVRSRAVGRSRFPKTLLRKADELEACARSPRKIPGDAPEPSGL